MSNDTHIKFSKDVDKLGEILAKIADLNTTADELKARLTNSGKKNKLDMDAVRAKLSPQFIAANTTKVPCVTVRVVARNNEQVRRAA